MHAINQTENNSKNNEARPDLGKAGKTQIVGVIETTPAETAALERAAAQLTRNGRWGKVIAGRIRVISINKYQDGTESSATHWFKSCDDALRFFNLGESSNGL